MRFHAFTPRARLLISCWFGMPSLNGAPVIVKKKKKERKLKIYRSASDPDISTFALARDARDAERFFRKVTKKARGSIHLRLFGCNSLAHAP